jgi:hypothetical protein
VAFVLPLGLALWLLLGELEERRGFADRELAGTRHLRTLRPLIEQVARARAAAHAFGREGVRMRPELVRRLGAVDAAMTAVGAADAELGGLLSTTLRFRTLQENRSFLREKAPTLSAAETAALFDELSTDIRALVVGVGDSSNLVLDPHLESYYLMDAAVVKLPEFTEIVVRARRTGLPGPASAAPDAEGKAELASLAGQLDAVRRSMREGLATSFSADPQGRLKAALGKPSSDWSAAADRLHALVDARMRDGARLTDAEYANAADAALDAGFDLWDRTSAELDAVRLRRVEAIGSDMRWVQAAAAAGVGVAAWLFLAFYLAVMRTVRSLRDAAARNVADVARQVYVDPAKRGEFVSLMARDGRVTSIRQEFDRACRAYAALGRGSWPRRPGPR